MSSSGRKLRRTVVATPSEVYPPQEVCGMKGQTVPHVKFEIDLYDADAEPFLNRKPCQVSFKPTVPELSKGLMWVAMNEIEDEHGNSWRATDGKIHGNRPTPGDVARGFMAAGLI